MSSLTSNPIKQDILAELDDKIKTEVVPTDKDKEILQYKLNKQLSEEDHLYIFTEILQSMGSQIYTITENCTLFDLNDVDPKNFWKIYRCAQMFIDNHSRQKELDKVKQENDVMSQEFNKNVENNLRKILQQNEEIYPSNATEYEKLRIDALKQCTYSTYSKKPSSDHSQDDGKLEKTVYSDNYQYKWKQFNKNDEIAKKIIKISAKHNHENGDVFETKMHKDEDNISIVSVDDDDDDDDEDDEDIMVNDKSSVDMNCGEDVKNELNDLKNSLLHRPKVKLSLKSNIIFDDSDE